MMTAEVFVTGRALGADEERELAGFDPVCGMAVEWATARFTLTHDGVDHAFCAPSCRKVFAEDNATA